MTINGVQQNSLFSFLNPFKKEKEPIKPEDRYPLTITGDTLSLSVFKSIRKESTIKLTQTDPTGINKAMTELEKNPDRIIVINQSSLKSLGIGIDLNLDLELNAGIKFREFVGATAASYKVNARLMYSALDSSKQHLLSAQGHYDQADMYNKLGNKLLEKALQLNAGPQQDKLLEQAEKYFSKAESEMKIGDIQVKEAQQAFLNGIGLPQNPPTPPQIPNFQNPNNKISK